MTKSQLIDALRDRSIRLADIPQNERCETLSRVALCYDKEAWAYIPDEFKSLEVIAKWISVGQSRTVGMHYNLPESFKSVEFHLHLLNLKPSTARNYPKVFEDVLEKLSDKQLDDVLELAPTLIVLLAKEKLTAERCTAALTKHYYLIEDIPEEFKTESLYRTLLTCRAMNLEDIPKERVNNELIELAVKHMSLEGPALKDVPEKLITRELCEKVVSDDGTNIAYVPDKYKTLDLCLSALDGGEFMGFQLNSIFNAIPEALVKEVKEKANFIRHIQPGEL